VPLAPRALAQGEQWRWSITSVFTDGMPTSGYTDTLDDAKREFATAWRRGLGLPIIGKLLGHAQAATTARYAHLDNDPLRRASEAIVYGWTPSWFSSVQY
jgi:integrase